MLTVSFIAAAMNAEDMVNIIKEQKNVTDERSAESALFLNK
jgi:hypothetical protein